MMDELEKTIVSIYVEKLPDTLSEMLTAQSVFVIIVRLVSFTLRNHKLLQYFAFFL